MNLLWIVLDAVRADHLSCYGYHRPTTPTIDSVAIDGVRFDEVITPGARTWESFCSFQTGLYPQRHGVRFVGAPGLAPEIPVLAEILHKQGFRTFGRTVDLSAAGLRRGFEDFDPQWQKKHSGIHRFRTVNNFVRRFDSGGPKPSDSHTADSKNTDESIEWIHRHKENKWFVLMRYLTAHWPYWPPSPFNELFHSDSEVDHSFNSYARRANIVAGRELSVGDIHHAISHYDGAIRFLDAQIGRLIEFLKTTDLIDDTLIVIMSDHGEGLGEHGYYFEHGDHVYEHLIRVPLIMRYPSLPKGRVVTAPVETIDLFQTVVELLGVNRPPASDSRSLVSLISGQGLGREHTFSESGRDFHNYSKRYLEGIAGAIRTVRRRDGWKLVYIPRHVNHEFELYHLPTDPTESRNVATQNPVIVDQLREALREWLEEPNRVLFSDEVDDTDPRVVERLRQLGYVE